VVIGKRNPELGSSEEEQSDNRRPQNEGAVEDSDGDEENRAPEVRKLPVRLLFFCCTFNCND
jgi:hypothetical protein